MLYRTANIIQPPAFDDIIDVRTPLEFAADHIPGARNCPVLGDDERARVGTLYKASPFEARRLGAALISRNTAELLDNEFHLNNKQWRPLVYCWRGGMRSASLALIMAQIGWPVHQLAGGYKSYRHHVLQQLAELPPQLTLKIVCGPTGSGKSRFLAALQRAGHQIIDLEGLASHRGSVLGCLPGEPQPTQRMFDSRLVTAIQQLDPARPVYIEAESRRIGSVSLPDSLYHHMHNSECMMLEVPETERVRFLCEDYEFYLQDPELLIKQLSCLSQLHSRQELDEWFQLARSGQFSELVRQLLRHHYDPLYWRSMGHHYPQLAQIQPLRLEKLDDETLDIAVRALG